MTQQSPSPFFDPEADLHVTRRNLPHWEQEGKTVFVTFRQADSLPREKRDLLKRDRKAWQACHGDTKPEDLLPTIRREYYRLFHERVEDWLDAGDGSCVLRDSVAARLVISALHHFNTKRYDLGVWAVAPNHVHALAAPYPGEDISAILHSWKSFTANKINKLLGQSGTFWMDENFDHIVRSEAQLIRLEHYISNHLRSGTGFPPMTAP